MPTKTSEKKKKKPQRSQGPPAPAPVPPVPVPATTGPMFGQLSPLDVAMASDYWRSRYNPDPMGVGLTPVAGKLGSLDVASPSPSDVSPVDPAIARWKQMEDLSQIIASIPGSAEATNLPSTPEESYRAHANAINQRAGFRGPGFPVGGFSGPVTSTGQPATTVPTALGPMPPQPPPQMPPGWGVRSTPFQPEGSVSDIGPDFSDVLAALQATGRPVRYGGPDATMLGTGTTEWVAPPPGGTIQDRPSYAAEVAQNRAALTNPAMTRVGFANDQGVTKPPRSITHTPSNPEQQEKARTKREKELERRQMNLAAKNMGNRGSLLQIMAKPPDQRTPEENATIIANNWGPESALGYLQSQTQRQQLDLKRWELQAQAARLQDPRFAYENYAAQEQTAGRTPIAFDIWKQGWTPPNLPPVPGAASSMNPSQTSTPPVPVPTKARNQRVPAPRQPKFSQQQPGDTEGYSQYVKEQEAGGLNSLPFADWQKIERGLKKMEAESPRPPLRTATEYQKQGFWPFRRTLPKHGGVPVTPAEDAQFKETWQRLGKKADAVRKELLARGLPPKVVDALIKEIQTAPGGDINYQVGSAFKPVF